MNCSNNLLIVSHQAVVRCIYTYLMKLPIKDLPYVKVRYQMHSAIKNIFFGDCFVVSKKIFDKLQTKYGDVCIYEVY